MDHREDIIKLLSELKEEFADRFKVDNLGLFGSLGRSEQDMESDIDILVEFRHGADLLDLVGLGDFLEKKPGRRVDIVGAMNDIAEFFEGMSQDEFEADKKTFGNSKLSVKRSSRCQTRS